MATIARVSPQEIQNILGTSGVSAKPTSLSGQSSSASFINALQRVFKGSNVTGGSNITGKTPIPGPNLGARPIVDEDKCIRLELPHKLQGENECGPASLAMILEYFGVNAGDWHNYFQLDTIGHDPLSLKAIADSKGMTVRQGNEGSLNDLARLIDSGIPPMILGSWGGHTSKTLDDMKENMASAHYMVVTGYVRNKSGEITTLYVNDPNSAFTVGMTVDNFNKFWASSTIPGQKNYYMAMAKKGSYQESSLTFQMKKDKISTSFFNTLLAANAMFKNAYALLLIAKGIDDFIGVFV